MRKKKWTEMLNNLCLYVMWTCHDKANMYTKFIWHGMSHAGGVSFKEITLGLGIVCRNKFLMPEPVCSFGTCMDLCVSKNYITLYGQLCLDSVTCACDHFC